MTTIELIRGSNVPTALITAEHDAIAPKRVALPLGGAIENLVFESAIDVGHNDRRDFAKTGREALVRPDDVSARPDARSEGLAS